MTTNNRAVRFTLVFADKTIVGTKASFTKAGKGFGPEYEELAEKMAKHPNFALVVKEPKKASKKVKKTYNGLTFRLMERYIRIQSNEAVLMEEYKGIKAFAKKDGHSIYPLTKQWFLGTFKDFDVDKAKKAIADAGIKSVKVAVKEKAATKEQVAVLTAPAVA